MKTTLLVIQNKLVAFHKVLLHNTFGEYLAAHNMTQARIAECRTNRRTALHHSHQ